MKKVVVVSVFLAVLLTFFAVSGYLDSITGLASDSSFIDFGRSIQIGVVLLAALGILVITLLNVTNKGE